MAKAGTRAKVPVAEVMAEAYRTVFGRLSLLLDLAWLPLILVLAAAILPGYLRFYHGIGRGIDALSGAPGNTLGFGVDDLIEALVGLFCLSAFAVRWYQSLLASSGQAPSDRFLGAWLRFLIYMVVLYLVAAVLLIAMLVVDTAGLPDFVAPVAAVAIIAAWLAPLRCSLLFPAAALGQPMSVGAAWRMMAGNTWRLFATVMLASVPTVFIVAMVMSSIAAALGLDSGGDTPPPLGFFLLRGVIASCADFLVVALSASVLAGFYRRIGRGAAAERLD